MKISCRVSGVNLWSPKNKDTREIIEIRSTMDSDVFGIVTIDSICRLAIIKQYALDKKVDIETAIEIGKAIVYEVYESTGLDRSYLIAEVEMHISRILGVLTSGSHKVDGAPYGLEVAEKLLNPIKNKSVSDLTDIYFRVFRGNLAEAETRENGVRVITINCKDEDSNEESVIEG